MSRADYGRRLREAIATRPPVPLIGVYDVLSASLAARHFEGVFLSGFSFAASYYGLPDIGFIAWSDMVAFAQRTRAILPDRHIMVDIDDGYCDTEVACHVVRLLEAAGASGVVLEDQQRPRRCGHVDGKQIMSLEGYLSKLERVLAARREMVVVARTDATEPEEALARARAFAAAGADAILIEAVSDLRMLQRIGREIDRPLVFNQLAGGKSAPVSLTELANAGVSLVHYSTPCLFAAQRAVDEALAQLRADDGRLPTGPVMLQQCNALLHDNLAHSAGRNETPA